MRIITGDECGLLKEVIPELCRPLNNNNASAIHAGRARPSATSIQAAAASYGTAATGNNNDHGGDDKSTILSIVANQHYRRAIQRLEQSDNVNEVMSRERGIISLAFLPSTSTSNNLQENSFNFAALHNNGIVETWEGNRGSDGNGNNDNEVNVTAASYKKIDGLVTSILPDNNNDNEKGDNDDDDDEEEDSNNDTKTKKSTLGGGGGWYAHQPIRPIGMVSNYYNSSSASNTGNPILATCDSIGIISLLNATQLSRGILTSYNAFDIPISSSSNNTHKLPSPSSSKNNSNATTTLTYTKGRYSNNNIATSLAICGGGHKLAVGGRERGMRILDLDSGKLVWKAKNLPPDPQTLLQQPMWTTYIQFLHTPTSALSSSSSSSSNTDIPCNLVATGSAYKQVQIYDIRVSSTSTRRRPVLHTPEHLLSHRITSLCQLHNGNTLAVGDTIGDVNLLDMRNMHSGKPSSNNKKSMNKKAKEEIGLGRLVGPGGSVRQLVMHPTLPYLTCVGLDRKLWMWDVKRGNGGKLVDCIYLRQRLNCLLVCDDESWDDKIVEGDEDGDKEEYNDAASDDDGGDEMAIGQGDLVEDYVNSDDDEQLVQRLNESGNADELNDEGSSSGTNSEEETESESGSNESEGDTPMKKRRKKYLMS